MESAATDLHIPQYRRVAKVLEQRILHGDYLIKDVPATRSLAKEMEVSHIVMCKAVELLTNEGLLDRKPNGRLIVRRATKDHKPQPRLAFVAPAFNSRTFQVLRIAVELAAAKVNALFRPVDYVHWEDAVFSDVLDSFDGAFVMNSSDPIPADLVDRLERSRCRVATFFMNLTQHGIPNIPVMEESGIRTLLDHLYGLGHRRICCFNTQPENLPTLGHINVWRQWCREHGVSGLLVSDPVQSYEDPLARAYETGLRMLRQITSDCTAVFCITSRATQGLLRAMADLQLKPGHDLSICTMDDECQVRYMVPSITALKMMDLATPVGALVDWMVHPNKKWTGDLNLRDGHASLFIGESTGAPPIAAVAGKS